MLSTISIETSKNMEMIDVTSYISAVVKKSNIKDGIVAITSPHTTCGVTINENTDPGLKRDILKTLSTLIPRDDLTYKHTGENADAHIKTSLVGNSVSIVVEENNLKLGPWQSVYLCEFDGPRDRQLFVKILAG